MFYSEKVKAFWAKYPELRLSRDTIAKLCPPCAEKMAKAGIAALVIKQGHPPAEMVSAMCDAMGGADGFFDRCMSHDFGDFNPDDKEAFCAWLHNECLGKFPSESEAFSDTDRWIRDLERKELADYRKGAGPAPVVYRAGGTVQKVAEGDDPFLFVASEESEDRFGDVISAAGWQLDNFQKNPVFLFGHDQTIPPIGSVSKVWTESKQLLAAVRFDDQDEFSRLVQGKYRRKFMRAVSVGFKALEFEDRQAQGQTSGILFKRQELIELSAVPVPAHPAALQRALGNRPRWSLPSEAYIKRIEALERRMDGKSSDDEVDVMALSRQVWKS